MKNRLFYILAILHFCFLSCFAQNQSKIDSLSAELLNQKIDTVKINIRNKLIFEYIDSRTDTAFSLVTYNLTLSEKINYLNGKAVSLYLLAYICRDKGDIQKALDYGNESLKISKLVKNNTNIANVYSLLGKVSLHIGKQDQALVYHFNALEIRKTLKNNTDIIASLNNVANTYTFQKNYKEALIYYNNALQIAQVTSDSAKIVGCINNIGNAYEELGEYNRALAYYEKALKLKNSIKNNQKIISVLFSNVGGIYAKQGKYYTGLPYLHQSLKIVQKINYTTGTVQVATKIAELYLNLNKLDSAKKYVFMSLEYKSTIKDESLEQVSYAILYEIEKKQENYKQAIRYYEKSVQLSNSIFNKDKEKIFEELQAKYKTQQQAQEIEFLKKENENKDFQTKFYIIIICFFTFFVILLCYFILRLNKNNRLLNTKNSEINQRKEEVKQLNEHLEDLVKVRTEELKHSVDNLLRQNQDLEQFSYIISHNIRSPVARILGLVNVFNVENMEDPFNLEILGHLEHAGENLDMVIKDLNKVISIRENFDVKKENVVFEDEIAITLEHLTMQISKSNTQIDCLFNVKSIQSIKSYVQSILYNLLSNAIKYKSDKRNPIIKFRTEIVDNFVCLFVQDNGLGIDLTTMDTYKIFGLYQRMHDHVRGKGLGLFLVKTQIESMGGKIEIESKLDVGTTFKVYFPNVV